MLKQSSQTIHCLCVCKEFIILNIILSVFVSQSFLTGSAAPAAGSSNSRLSSSTPVPASYFTPVSNNNNSSSGPTQFVRVVTSNAPIQPKLLPGMCINISLCYIVN